MPDRYSDVSVGGNKAGVGNMEVGIPSLDRQAHPSASSKFSNPDRRVPITLGRRILARLSIQYMFREKWDIHIQVH